MNHTMVGMLAIVLVLIAGCGNGVDTTGDRSIYVLAANGDLPGVRQGLANGFDVDTPDAEGLTLLHHAVRGGHAQLVELLLLTHRANPSVPDKNGATAIDLAIESQDGAILEVLHNEGLVTY